MATMTTTTTTTTIKSPAGRAAATRERILSAAERLFANDGFDRVTLRQIARASDQRNVAAVQYHFGSKDGLLAAIVDGHRSEIDDARDALLASLEAKDREPDLAQVLEVLVEPLCQKLDDPSGRAYLRIQAESLHNEAMRPATRRVVSRIGRIIGGLDHPKPTPYLDRFATLLLFHALADRARQEEVGNATRADRRPFIEALRQSLIGLLRQSTAA
jgi:AcrR family transcriptional regulator